MDVKARTGLVALALLFALAAPAMAQREEHQFRLEWSAEMAEAQLEITGSSNNMGLPASDLETDVDFFARSGGVFLSGVYGYHGMRDAVISGRFRLGLEQLGSHIEIGPANPEFGDTDGTQNQDILYDPSFAWEIGAGFRYLVDPKFDAGLSLSFRGGGGETSDVSEKLTFDYTQFRVVLEGGWRATEGVRPFLGVRYTLYDGEFKRTDKPGGDYFTFELEYDMPIGVALGVDLEKGPVSGRLEVDLLDSLGFLASVGWKF